MSSANEGHGPEALPILSKVEELRKELDELKTQNAEVVGKFEATNSAQGCLGFAIIGACTIFGAILGFGLFSIVTGVGGFLVGVMIAAPFMKDSKGKAEYEARKLRILEIERILSQAN